MSNTNLAKENIFNVIFNDDDVLRFYGFPDLKGDVISLRANNAIALRPAGKADENVTFRLNGHECKSKVVLDYFMSANAIGCHFSCANGVYYQTDITVNKEQIGITE